MPSFLLKVIASVCMLIDHIGAVFPAATPAVFRCIGRIAFPVYAYLIAQGCKQTKNIYKYLFRLGLFALISELPFDLAFNRYSMDGQENFFILFLERTNIFYTLFLGVACVIVYEKLQTKKHIWLASLPILPVVLSVAIVLLVPGIESWWIPVLLGFIVYLAVQLCLAYFLPENASVPETNSLEKYSKKTPAVFIAGRRFAKRIFTLCLTIPIFMLGSIMDTDYGMYGVIFILFFYLLKPENRITRTVAAVIVVFLQYAYEYFYFRGDSYGIQLPPLLGRPMFNVGTLTYFWFALAAVPLVFLYNGRQGPKLKWVFYIFYPAHIAVLAAIYFFTSN